ncbi:hypothetical protein QBC35DRAFT_540022, partial [Podospora australis]
CYLQHRKKHPALPLPSPRPPIKFNRPIGKLPLPLRVLLSRDNGPSFLAQFRLSPELHDGRVQVSLPRLPLGIIVPKVSCREGVIFKDVNGTSIPFFWEKFPVRINGPMNVDAVLIFQVSSLEIEPVLREVLDDVPLELRVKVVFGFGADHFGKGDTGTEELEKSAGHEGVEHGHVKVPVGADAVTGAEIGRGWDGVAEKRWEAEGEEKFDAARLVETNGEVAGVDHFDLCRFDIELGGRVRHCCGLGRSEGTSWVGGLCV